MRLKKSKGVLYIKSFYYANFYSYYERFAAYHAERDIEESP